MKRNTLQIFLNCLFICSLIFGSCTEKEESLYINLDTNTLTFESDGGSETIKASSNGYWTISGETDWCEVSPKTGNGNLTVTVIVSENESIEERKATLIFRCGTETAEVVVTQSIPDWVEINGVKWATRNVGTPGTFVAKPEDYGGYYQWNRPTTDFLLWDDYYESDYYWSRFWLFDNDVSPAGYRVPTLGEFWKLLSTEKVSHEWTTRNGINGRKFTDRATGNCVFLPSAGYRDGYDGTFDYVGSGGYYWSSTQYEVGSYRAYNLYFDSDYAGWYGEWFKSFGFTVRPVVAE